jgi:putative transposase
MKLRQSPRLRDFGYAGHHAYSLAMVTRGRHTCLTSPEAVDTCIQALHDACEKYGFQCLAYCFMPDHARLLVTGRFHNTQLRDFARHFKQISSFRFKKAHGSPLWQISYYDHVLRQEEESEIVAKYIWDNPVRKGLAENRSGYPYSGPRELITDD